MRKIFVFVLFLSGFYSISAQQLWRKIDKGNAIQQKKEFYQLKKLPSSYQLFSFKNTLFFNLTAKTKSLKQAIIELPDENGQFSEFYIQKTQNFQPKLAVKFPSIQSFKIVKVSDSSAKGRISTGTDGFHAVINSPNRKPLFITPLTKDKSQYIVYNKESMATEKNHFECELLDENNLMRKVANSNQINDGFLRTYRIAIVASAEYSQYHLNLEGVGVAASEQVKKATVLSAINTSLTRINEVFENALSVNFTLVGDNDKIIYFDTSTDGITNGDIMKMVNECQAICDREISNANYDIGHLFSQGIGDEGAAAPGTVCLSGQKGRASTSKDVPVGETFDVDYFAHEIGHQFGAFHTFNNFCFKDARIQETAMEPGSGSTIMSYAGICSPNVQNQVDDYFHNISLTQMWNVIQSSAACANLTSNNNTPPTVDAGLDYAIPKGTPFVLTGSGGDLENEGTLTYSWEQMDNEIVSMPPVSTSDEGPTFRSLAPKNVPERFFPSLADVVAGNSPEWEVLPTVARSLNFTLTARDNNPTGGAFAKDNLTVTLTDAAPFVVTSQNTEEIWDVGTTQTITWNVGDTNQSPINTQFVTVKYSIDGGKTFPFLLIERTVNDGTESFVVPENISKNVRIMVMAVDNIFYDVNNVDIEIRSNMPTFIFTVENNTDFACNSGDESVTYNFNLDFINNFSEEVSFSADGLPDGVSASFSPETISADGSVQLTITNLNNVNAQEYAVRIAGSITNIVRNIDLNLTVTETLTNELNLTFPADKSDEVPLVTGFSWQENTNASSYNIQVALDENFNDLIIDANTLINAYTSLTLANGKEYFWRVRAINTCSQGNFSEVFSFTTEVCDVCTSVGNTEYETSTTFVGFNTIANATPNKSSGYMDFSEISTSVARDSTYTLTVNANTADDDQGSFTTYSFAWIDWNQDCEFSEEETYNLGLTRGSTNGQTSLSPFEIKVPSNAILGSTTMRITTKYDGGDPLNPQFPTMCEIGADAEVEDYTIMVDETAAVQNFNFDDFELYPNPTTNSFSIKLFLKSQQELQVQIVDLRGRIIEQREFQNLGNVFFSTIKFDRKTPGMYFVRLINGDNVLVKRLILRE